MQSSLSRKNAAPAAISMKIVNPLIESVIDTFDVMFNACVERSGLALRKEDASYLTYAAIIGVSGSAQGSFCLSVADDTAVEAVTRFTGMEVNPGSQLLSDGVAEMCNVIVGGMKDRLSIALNLGIPNVISGADYKVDFPPQSTPMRIEFSSEIGPLFIDFGFVCSSM